MLQKQSKKRTSSFERSRSNLQRQWEKHQDFLTPKTVCNSHIFNHPSEAQSLGWLLFKRWTLTSQSPSKAGSGSPMSACFLRHRTWGMGLYASWLEEHWCGFSVNWTLRRPMSRRLKINPRTGNWTISRSQVYVARHFNLQYIPAPYLGKEYIKLFQGWTLKCLYFHSHFHLDVSLWWTARGVRIH